jgi:secondary thiamine-phosphate synthase enzyme
MIHPRHFRQVIPPRAVSGGPVCSEGASEDFAMIGSMMIGSMRFHTEYLKFQTKQHRQYINITAEVDAALKKSGIREGMILVSAMHITAGVWVNDAEDGLLADIDEWLEKLAPFRENYRHHRTGETNGDAHLKSLVVHHQVIVPVTDGKLDFGPWQQVYYAEFDGQRPKRVIIKVMGE